MTGVQTCALPIYYRFSVFASDLALFPDRIRKQGSFWCADRDRSDGTYDDSGNIEYCCRHKFYTEYRNYTSVYQLWVKLVDVGIDCDRNGT